MPDSEEGIFIPIHLDDSDLEREGEQAKTKVGRIADDMEQRSRRSVAQRPSSLQGQGGGISGMLGGGGGIMGMVGMATGIGGISSLVTTLMSVTGISEKLGKAFSDLTESGAKLFGIETERAVQEKARFEDVKTQRDIAGETDPREVLRKRELSERIKIAESEESPEIKGQRSLAAWERYQRGLAGISRQEFATGASILGIDPSQQLSTGDLAAIRKAVEESAEASKRMADNAERYRGQSTPGNF